MTLLVGGAQVLDAFGRPERVSYSTGGEFVFWHYRRSETEGAAFAAFQFADGQVVRVFDSGS